jgi:hypothetical protein
VLWDDLKKDAVHMLTTLSGAAYFYAAQLRFFRSLLGHSKVSTIVGEAVDGLDNGFNIVLTCVSTDECSVARQLKKKDDDEETDEPVVDEDVARVRNRIERGMLLDTFEAVLEYAESTTPDTSVHFKLAALKTRARSMDLPAISVIDTVTRHLARHLGGYAQIAELTGRRYQLRVDSFDDDASNLNNWNITSKTADVTSERARFQGGGARVCILSAACSTGVSLHHDSDKTGRRKMISMELPYSGQSMAQVLGRCHRSNQRSAPKLCMVTSEQAGDKRFAAAIAAKLESLGAACSSDRRAGSGAVAFDSAAFAGNLGNRAAEAICAKHGMNLGQNPTGIRFLNRALAMTVDGGTTAVQDLSEKMAELEEADRKKGKKPAVICETIEDGQHVQLSKSIYRPDGGQLLTFRVDSGANFDDARAKRTELLKLSSDVKFYTSIANEVSPTMNIVLGHRCGNNVFAYRPNGRKAKFHAFDFDKKYTPVLTDEDTLEKQWNKAFDAAQSRCSHPRCYRAGCKVGLRHKTVNSVTFPCLSVLRHTHMDDICLRRVTLTSGAKHLCLDVTTYKAARISETAASSSSGAGSSSSSSSN